MTFVPNLLTSATLAARSCGWCSLAFLLTAQPALAQCVDYADGPPAVFGNMVLGSPNDIEVVGNIAHVADGLIGLRVSNVADPNNPRGGRFIDLPGSLEALGVATSQGHAYVAFEEAGLVAVEVENRQHLVITSITPTADRAVEVTANDCYAYVSHDSGFQIMDIGDPGFPVPLANVPVPDGVRTTAAARTLVYAAAADLWIVDVSVPSDPVVLTNMPVSGGIRDIVVAGRFAFILSDSNTLEIVDVETPSSPSIVSSLGLAGDANSIAHQSGIVYIAAGSSGMHVIDVTNPLTPAFVETLATPDFASAVDVSLGNVYVASQASGFQAGNLTIGPSHCVPPSVPTEKNCVTLELEMLAGIGGSVLPETSKRAPRSQVTITAQPLPHYVFREWVGQGNGSYSGLDSVTTVTMYEPLQEVALFDRIGHEVTLSFSDTDPYVHAAPPIGFGRVYLWVACSTAGGITGFRGSIEGTLPVVGFTPAPGVISAGTYTDLDLVMTSCVTGPALLGEFLVLSPGAGTLCLSDGGPGEPASVRDCKLPAVEFVWPDDLRLAGVRTDGGTPCASGRDCEEGATVAATTTAPTMASRLTAAAPSATLGSDQLWATSPNPFTESTRIRYSLSTPGRVRVSVFSAAGRRVADVVNADQSVGIHDVSWTGRSSSGARLPAGVYFVRLEAPGFSQTRKTILLGR